MFRHLRSSRLQCSAVFVIGIMVLPITASSESPHDGITRSVGNVSASSVSSDGRLAAYTDWKTGKVMLLDLRTGVDKVVSPGGYPGYGMFAQISPDGTQVAYGWAINMNRWDLRVFDFSTSTERVLQKGVDGDIFFPLDWSSDGKSILVTTRESLASFSAKNGSKRDIYSFEQGKSTTRAWFSNDGKLVAFDLDGEDIFAFSLERGRIVAELSAPTDDSLIGWLPTGKRLLFDRKNEGLFTTSLKDGGFTAPVVFTRKRLGEPVGIENGSLFLNNTVWENDLYLADFDPEQSTFSEPRKMASNLTWQSGAAWSTDGSRFLYAAPNGWGSTNFVVRAFPSGAEKQITCNLRSYHFVGPHWSSDSCSVIVGARPDGPGLVGVNIETAAVTPLVTAKKDGVLDGIIEWPTSAPKGIVYFAKLSNRFDSFKIAGRDATSKKETTVYTSDNSEPGLMPIHLALSDDGKHLALLEQIGEKRPSTLSVINVSNGRRSPLFTIKEGQVLYSPAWTPEGKILFGVGTSANPDSNLQLWRSDPAKGEIVQLADQVLTGRALNRLSVHPDGNKVLFTASRIFADGTVTIPSWYRDLRYDLRVVDDMDALANHD